MSNLGFFSIGNRYFETPCSYIPLEKNKQNICMHLSCERVFGFLADIQAFITK